MGDVRREKELDALQLSIIEKLKIHVQKSMLPDPTGHDWPHVSRVLKNAIKINETENGNLFHITLIALTHDLYDHKFFNGTQIEAEQLLLDLLINFGVTKIESSEIVKQVFNLSYSSKGRPASSWKNGQSTSETLSKEGKIVQDADRIEAIGAIGIARAFAYGGFKNRLMNGKEKSGSGSGDIQIEKGKTNIAAVGSGSSNMSNEKNIPTGTTFDHFFEKLLKLYDLLNTETAKKIAKDRFEFMQEFVRRFDEEWNNI